MNNLIFDLDGTLIDSSKCIYGLYDVLFKELGFPLMSAEDKKKVIGPPVEKVLSGYLKGEQLKRGCERFRELYDKVDLKSTNKLYPGTEIMLQTLKDKGRRLFIASTKNQQKARLIPNLLGIDKYFDGIYGSVASEKRINKSDVLNSLCTEMNIPKNDCYLIGDTHYDAEGAMEFGIKTVIVKYGFGNEEEIKKFPVEMFLETTKEVAEKL